MDSFEELFTKKIREADMVLVGLGEEFDQMNPSENAAFAESEMMAQNLKWLIPAFRSYDTSQDAFEKREKKQKRRILRDQNRNVSFPSITKRVNL